MTKKLLFAGFLTTALATLALIAEPVSADYYDCNGNLKSGDPTPSECHYFLSPQRTTSSSSDRTRANVVTNTGSTTTATSSSGRNRANIVTSTGSASSTSSTSSSDRNRANIVTNNGSSSNSSTGSTTSTSGRNRANIITEIGRNYSDLEEARNSEDAIIINDDNGDYSKEYEVRNPRKYCVRDYCYIVYDYCYDLTHCEQKVDRIPRDEYEDNYGDYDNWRDMFEDYLNDYFGRNPNGNCRPQTGRCVYRGFYFGGSHNGYWYY